MTKNDAVNALLALRFSRLEAEIYLLLLRESPVTGYRLSQLLKRPAANTYKAVRSLEARGAVVIEDGDAKRCRAVAPKQLLSRLDLSFQKRRVKALESLGTWATPPDDERLYKLISSDRVLERARSMLERAEKVALMVASAAWLSELRTHIKHAGWRGVDVVVKTYQPASVQGAEVVVSSDSERMEREWVFDDLHLVMDCRESLGAFSPRGEPSLTYAFWTQNLYLSNLHHNGLAAELALTSQARQFRNSGDETALKSLLARVRNPLETPGYEELRSRMAAALAEAPQPLDLVEELGTESGEEALAETVEIRRPTVVKGAVAKGPRPRKKSG